MLLVQAPADIRASAFNPVYKWWNWVKLERGEGVKTVDIRWFHPQEPLFWKLIQAYGAVFEVPYLNLVGLSSGSSGFSLAQKKYRVKRAIFTILFSCSKPTCFIPCRNQSRNGNTLVTWKLHSGLLSIYFRLQNTKTLSRVQKSIEKWNASYLTPQPTVSFGSRIFLFPLDTEIQSFSQFQTFVKYSRTCSVTSRIRYSERESVLHACSTDYCRTWILPNTADQWRDQTQVSDDLDIDWDRHYWVASSETIELNQHQFWAVESEPTDVRNAILMLKMLQTYLEMLFLTKKVETGGAGHADT